MASSHSTDSSLTAAAAAAASATSAAVTVAPMQPENNGASDSDYSVDDDEMLYACIKSAMPKAKPLPPKRTVSVSAATVAISPSSKTSSSSSLTSNQRVRQPRPPMELPKNVPKEVFNFSHSFTRLTSMRLVIE